MKALIVSYQRGRHLVHQNHAIIKIKGNFKIKLGMMNPEQVLGYLDELIKVYKSDKMVKFIHIPYYCQQDCIAIILRPMISMAQ